MGEGDAAVVEAGGVEGRSAGVVGLDEAVGFCGCGCVCVCGWERKGGEDEGLEGSRGG